MKLIPKKNGKGFISSYLAVIGSKEARELEFIDLNGKSKEIEKIIDYENKTITFKVKED